MKMRDQSPVFGSCSVNSDLPSLSHARTHARIFPLVHFSAAIAHPSRCFDVESMKRLHLALRIIVDGASVVLLTFGAVSIYKSGFFWQDAYKNPSRAKREAAARQEGDGKV